MLRYLIRRIIWAFIMMAAVIATVFIIFFVLPGGTGKTKAVTQSDLPVILGTTLVASGFVIFANVIVDIGYAYMDPRVVYT